MVGRPVSRRFEMQNNGNPEKQISCGDVVPGCGFEASAKTDAELLEKVGRHARETHGLAEIPPELAEKVKQAIRTRSL
jgi:predicted small metal-binding protein